MSSQKQVRPTQVLVLVDKEATRLVVAYSIVLPSQQAVKQVVSKANRTFALSDEGKIYEFEAQSIGLSQLLLVPATVRMIACNASAVLMVCDSGQVYGKGRDPESYGFLGGLEEAVQPTLLPGLSTQISQAGLGATHGAALDSTYYTEDGKLWTWGTGANGQLGRTSDFQQGPALVQSAEVYNGKGLVCGDQVTVVITSGGFLYMFGSIGGHSMASGTTQSLRRLRTSFSRSLSAAVNNTRPLTLPGLQNKFVVSAAVGLSFLGILTDNGEVYFFDDCLDIVRLPTQSHSRLHSLGSTSSSLYSLSLSDRIIYHWTEPDVSPLTRSLMQTLSSSGHCQLLAWAGKAYSLASTQTAHSLKPDTEHISIYSDATPTPTQFAYLLCELMPYKRSQYITNLMQSFYDSLGKWKRPEQRESPMPFLTRDSPIPFEESSEDYSLAMLEGEMREKPADWGVGRVVETLNKVIKGVYFRQVLSFSFLKRQYSLCKEALPQYLLQLSVSYRLLHLSVSLSSIQTYGLALKQFKQTEARETAQRNMSKMEGTKVLFRLLSVYVKGRLRAGMRGVREGRANSEKKRKIALEKLVTRHEARCKDSLTTAWAKWKLHIVKFHIKSDGLKKLCTVLQKRVVVNCFSRIAANSHRIQLQAGHIWALVSRKLARGLKFTQNRYFTRWKDVMTRLRMQSARRKALLVSGAKAFATRFKVYLRKCLFRPVLAQLQSAENRKAYLSRLKYPLVFLDMKVAKIKRRLLNFSFNRLFRTQPHPKWSRHQSSFTHLQVLSALHLRPVFSLLSHDSDNSYIQLVVSLVPLVTLMSRKTTFGLRFAWVKLLENSLEAIGEDPDINEVLFFPPAPLLNMNGRTPSPTKASLRIPSILDFPLSAIQSPLTKDTQPQGHRPSKSTKIAPQAVVKSADKGDKPPWKRPSAATSFSTGSKPFSPRERRVEYARNLRDKQTPQHTPATHKFQSPPAHNARSLDPERADSPTALLTFQAKLTNRLISTSSSRPSSSTMRLQGSKAGLRSPRQAEESGLSSLYAVSTFTSSYARDAEMKRSRFRQEQVRELVKMGENLLFSVRFRAFVMLKGFEGHETLQEEVNRTDEDLEVDWHKRIYLIGAERVRRLLRELIRRQEKAGFEVLAA